ncbi:MAG: LptA/OstA family protein [Gammaproteobacteria bacterium]|tara:strand:+ start:592 stop:993 length:402 start_codon:yes stop_codon:yes gene_type:complete
MLKIKKTLLIFIGFFCSTILISEEELNFQNISIQSDEVTINEKDRLLAFKNNLEIKIENYIIVGSKALLNQEDEKLEIYGNPTSIQSMSINGEAEVLVIYPNKTIDLIGNAKLKKDGNLITSDLITYQINLNE